MTKLGTGKYSSDSSRGSQSGIPPGPRLPRILVGMQWLLTEHRFLERCRRRYGDVFSLKMRKLGLLVVICDPAEIKRVFTTDTDIARGGEGNSVTEPVAGSESILLLEGKEHLEKRKQMLPPFHGERLGVYSEMITESIDREIDTWPLQQTPFSMHASMDKVAGEVILRTTLGDDIEDDNRVELEALVPKLITSPALLWPALQHDLGKRSPWRRFVSLRDRVDKILFEEISRKRADPNLAERDDVLSMLMLIEDEHGKLMDDQELRDQLVTLLVTGHETTATALAWTFERLLRNPAVLERLRASLAEGEEDYLNCVIKESLRSRPIIPYALRRLSAPLEIGGYTVPAGAYLGCSTILTHQRPDIYPDPDEFRPERFQDSATQNYAWIPFGGGVRRCLGASFANLEMRVILKRVFERCELIAPDLTPERPRRHFITYRPNHGASVLLMERRDASPAVTPVPAAGPS